MLLLRCVNGLGRRAWLSVVVLGGCVQILGLGEPGPGGPGATADAGLPGPDADPLAPDGGGGVCSNPPVVPFSGPSSYAIGQNPQAIAVGDLNQDGRDDVAIATASTDATAVSIFFNQGNDSLGPRQDVASGCNGGATMVLIGDVSHDGRNDLVIKGSSCGSAISIRVLVQKVTPPGTFEAPMDYEHLGSPASGAVGDVDGDGRQDLVLGAALGSGISVFLQDPAAPGAFLPRVDYAADVETLSAQLADLDGDARLDIVWLAGGTTAARWLPQNPLDPGTFLGARDLTTPPTSGSSFAIGLLDGDTLPDAVVGTQLLHQLPGMPGEFGAPVTISTSGVIRVADLDGDGRDDVISAAGIELQCATSPGVFPSAPQALPGTPGNVIVAIADLDDDGKQDLATVRGSVPTLIVFLQP